MKTCIRCGGHGQIQSGNMRGLESGTGGVSSSADWQDEGEWMPVWSECEDCGGVGFFENLKLLRLENTLRSRKKEGTSDG